MSDHCSTTSSRGEDLELIYREAPNSGFGGERRAFSTTSGGFGGDRGGDRFGSAGGFGGEDDMLHESGRY